MHCLPGTRPPSQDCHVMAGGKAYARESMRWLLHHFGGTPCQSGLPSNSWAWGCPQNYDLLVKAWAFTREQNTGSSRTCACWLVRLPHLLGVWPVQRCVCMGQNCFWCWWFFHISEWCWQCPFLHTIHCQGMNIRFLCHSAHHNNRNVPPCRVHAHGPVKAQPTFFRHHYVQGNKVWKCLPKKG